MAIEWLVWLAFLAIVATFAVAVGAAVLGLVAFLPAATFSRSRYGAWPAWFAPVRTATGIGLVYTPAAGGLLAVVLK